MQNCKIRKIRKIFQLNNRILSGKKNHLATIILSHSSKVENILYFLLVKRFNATIFVFREAIY